MGRLFHSQFQTKRIQNASSKNVYYSMQGSSCEAHSISGFKICFFEVQLRTSKDRIFTHGKTKNSEKSCHGTSTGNCNKHGSRSPCRSCCTRFGCPCLLRRWYVRRDGSC